MVLAERIKGPWQEWEGAHVHVAYVIEMPYFLRKPELKNRYSKLLSFL